MAKYFINEETLKNMADTIRSLTGSTGSLTPSQMTQEVEVTKENVDNVMNVLESLGVEIPEGSDIGDLADLVEQNPPATSINLQDKTITENGTYTADSGYDGLGNVTVNVENSGGGALQASNVYIGVIPSPTASGNEDCYISYMMYNEHSGTISGIISGTLPLDFADGGPGVDISTAINSIIFLYSNASIAWQVFYPNGCTVIYVDTQCIAIRIDSSIASFDLTIM